MNTTSITITTEPEIKEKITQIASEVGLTVSEFINKYLKKIARTKTTYVELRDEAPTPYLLKSIEKARKELREGKASPRFTNAKDAIRWLNS